MMAAGLAGVAGVNSLSAAADNDDGKREYYEMRRYHLHIGTKKNLVSDFLREVGIPGIFELRTYESHNIYADL